jgi:hypothetical protein
MSSDDFLDDGPKDRFAITIRGHDILGTVRDAERDRGNAHQDRDILTAIFPEKLDCAIAMVESLSVVENMELEALGISPD